jgi:hypothetical protein
MESHGASEMNNEEKRRPGRPRSRPDEEPGQFVGFRAPRELKNRLEATAAQNGRSISTEAQFRLEQSFRNEDVDRAMDMAYGPQTAGLIEALGLTIRDTVTLSSSPASPLQSGWLSDPSVFASVKAAVDTIFEGLRPAGDAAQVSMHGHPVGPGVAAGILRDIAYGKADSAADHARLGARLREKLGPAATRRLKAALEGQAHQPEPNQ